MSRWVVAKRGACKGMIGFVAADIYGKSRKVLVRFGSSGPDRRLRETSVRKATLEEIATVAGCRVQDLPASTIKDNPQ